MVGKINLLV